MEHQTEGRPHWLDINEVANLWACIVRVDESVDDLTLAESLSLLSKENTRSYRNNRPKDDEPKEEVPHSPEYIMNVGILLLSHDCAEHLLSNENAIKTACKIQSHYGCVSLNARMLAALTQIINVNVQLSKELELLKQDKGKKNDLQ